MNFVFDIFLVIIMSLIIFTCYRRGALASVLSLASGIVSLLASWLFYAPLADYLNDNFISFPFIKTLRDKISALATDGNIEKMLNEMPKEFTEFLKELGTDPETIQNGFYECGVSAASYADSIAENIGSALSYTLSCGIAMLVIFTVSSIICSVISLILNSVVKLPILNSTNKLLGLILGICGAVVFAWVFSQCSVMLFDSLKAIYPDAFNSESIENSYIINFFYSINPLTFLTA